MQWSHPQLFLILEGVVFITVVVLHLARKNTSAIYLYAIQSVAISLLLLLSTYGRISVLLFLATTLTIAVKVLIAPYFFLQLVKRHQLTFTASTYANVPGTLLGIAAGTTFARAARFFPITTLSSGGPDQPTLALATMFVALLLVVNRKGALSQILGVLSLENGIVAFALVSGLEQNPAFQLGITVNILVWVIISTLFASMVVKQFGSLDVTAMKRLTD